MKNLCFLCVVVLLGGCGRAESRDDLDYTQNYIPTAADSARAPTTDSVMATIAAYNQGRISAEAAATIIVNYLMISRSLGGDFDQKLQRAVTEELRRRMLRR